MPELHLRQLVFTCCTRGPICRNEMAYEDFKDSPKRTASDKELRDEAFNIAKNPKYDGYQRGLASMVNLLIKNFRWCY